MNTIVRMSSADVEAWVSEYLMPRYPELVQAFNDALDLCRKGHASGTFGESDALRLLAHAKSSRKPLGENAAAFLGELCDEHATAREAVRTLASGSNVNERVNALVALDSCQTSMLHEEVFAKALADRSARVRLLAADKVVVHGVKSLDVALQAAIAREKNPSKKAELARDREYLLYGHHVRHEGEYVYVTCRPPHWSSTSKCFTRAEFKKDGLKWIARHSSRQQNA